MSERGLSEWLESPQGRYLLAWEKAAFDEMVADIFGYNALQVGLPGLPLLEHSRMSWRFSSSTDRGAPVVTNAHALPFATASLDLVLLPHVLEFSPYPHQVLREIERVLVPEGSVIISGFNPFSLWGIRRMLARSDCGYPWRGHYYSSPRIKDWLTLLGFEAQESRLGCYRPAVRTSKWIERWRFMDRAGARWWPICGGAWVLHGIKRVHGMRLITPKWRDLRAAEKRLAPVVRRGRGVAGNLQRIDEQD